MRFRIRPRVVAVAGALLLCSSLVLGAAPRAGAVTIPGPPDNGAIRNLAGCTANTLPGNDDGSTSPLAAIPFGFDIDFSGTPFHGAYVNNNGNITLDGTMSTYTPFSLLSTQRPMMA